MIKIGVVGGTGLTAGELLRILVYHPEANIQWVFSRSSANQSICSVHPDILELESKRFTNALDWNIDVVFLCLPHGKALPFLSENKLPETVKIIDLSRDFRLGNDSNYIYGLPELNRNRIKNSNYISNPGCFATAIQLALLPLAKEQLIKSDIHVHAITGSTGAGKNLSSTTHFTWRNSNVSVYKVLKHQHLDEVLRSVNQLQSELGSKILFVPMRGNFTRGILCSLYTSFEGNQDQALEMYQSFYRDHPFISVSSNPIDLKQVVNTNKARISIQVIDGYIHVVSIIDNLLKGASGQAVQNMNLIFGLDESMGLKLKSTAF